MESWGEHPLPCPRWQDGFGDEYAKRNPLTPEAMDALWRERFGISRTTMNARFLYDVPREARILEVGCNVGTQLALLARRGFTDLHGIEINPRTVELAHALYPDLDIREGDAADLPFADNDFDLVFTSGVLIHIPPSILPRVMDEMLRVSKRWVWGYEYWAPEMTEVEYRSHSGMLWKADYAALMAKRTECQVRIDMLPYRHEPLADAMYLLEVAR